MSTFFTLWEVTAAVTLERIQIAIKMRKYTTILWDLDQTILILQGHRDYAPRYTFCQFDKEIGEAEVSVYAAINDEHWKRMERGEITKEEVLLGRFIVLFERLGITEISPEVFGETYQEALGDVFFFRMRRMS